MLPIRSTAKFSAISFFGGPSVTGSYKHSAISSPNAIRVLVLHPGKGRDPLRCTFREHQLLSDEELAALKWERNSKGVGSYQAISYTWHDDDSESQFDSIFCDGRVIRITMNLANLLYRLRSDVEQELWIDQLSINQNDNTEKACQIPLMGKVYEQAARVTLWLGEEKEDTRIGFDLALKLRLLYLQSGGIYPLPSHIHQATELAKLGLPDLTSGQWWALMELLSRKVLQRLWIVQEVIKASLIFVRCGGQVTDFGALAAAAIFIDNSEWTLALQIGYHEHHLCTDGTPLDPWQLPQINHLCRMGMRRSEYANGELVSMEQLLMDTRSCKASDDFRQDRIYALLGIFASSHSKGELPAQFGVSYSTPPEVLYRNVTRYLLENGSLDILSVIEDRVIRSPSVPLPSWVPNFHVHQETEVIGSTATTKVCYTVNGQTCHVTVSRISESYTDTTFQAGGAYIPPTSAEEPLVLAIKAYRIAGVCLTSLLCHDPLSQEASLKGCTKVDDWFSKYYPDTLSQAEFLDSCAKTHDWFSPGYPNGLSAIEAFWRTLIADTGYGYLCPAPKGALLKSFFGLCLESMALLMVRYEMEQLQATGYVIRDSDRGTIPPELESRLWEQARLKDDEPDGREHVILGVYMNETGITIPMSPGRFARDAGKWAAGLFWVFSQLVPMAMANGWLEGADGSLYKATLRRYCWHRRFFSTAQGNGYFGIGPRSLTYEDEVFVLQGARVPFILRKVAEGEYTIVGEAFIYGMMHGEALALEGFKWEDIRIQ